VAAVRGWLMAGLLGSGVITACTESPRSETEPPKPTYLGIETRLMDGDLVNFRVALRGTRERVAVATYAECAAAQYALIRGYGFARHVRTNVTERGGVWRADAVYTISSALPRGIKPLDAEVVTQSCREQGIPTV
jgi:hypothetical protein